MAYEVGSLVVELSANVARLSSDMQKAQSTVDRSMSAVKSAAASAQAALGGLGIGLSATAFVTSMQATIDFADHLNDLSQQLGISVRDLGTWKLAASQSGASMESIAKGVKSLATYMTEHSDKMRAAGITAKDANGALVQLSDIFAAMPDGIQKTNLATTLFGKAGLELIPMLNQGSVGLEDVKEKARIYSERMAVLAPLADKFNDQLAELGLRSKTAGANIATQLLPPIIQLLEEINRTSVIDTFTSRWGAAFKGLAAGANEMLAATEEWLSRMTFGGVSENHAKLAAQYRESAKQIWTSLAAMDRSPSPSSASSSSLTRSQAENAASKLTSSSGAAKISDYDRIIAKVREKMAVESEEAALGRKLTDDEKYGLEIARMMTEAKGGLTQAQRLNIQAETESVQIIMRRNAATDAARKADEERRKAMAEALGEEYKSVFAMQAGVEKLQEESESLGISSLQLAEYKAAKLESAAVSDGEFARALEEAAASITDESKAAQEAREYYLKLAEAKRLAAKAGMDQATLTRQIGARSENLRAETEMWQSIESTAHTTFTNIFNGGADAFTRLRDTLKNTLYDLLYQMTVKKWIIQIAGEFGASGSTLQALGATSGMGGLGGAGNLLSTGNSLYSGYSGGSQSLFNSFAYSGIGQSVGLSTSLDLAGSQALGMGADAVGATSLTGAGSFLSSLAAAAPYIAAAVAVLSMIDWGGGTPHTGGTAYSSGEGYQTPRGRDAINAYYADPTADNKMALSDWTKRWSQATADALGPAAEGFAKTFNKIVMANGAAGGYTVGLGFSADGEDPVRARSTILDALGRQVAWTRDFNKLGSDPQKGLELMLTDQVPKLMLSALREVDLGKTLNEFFDSSITSAGDLLQTLTKEQTSAMLELMSSGTLDDIIDRMHLTRMSFANVATSVTDFLPAMQQAEQAFQSVAAQIADIRAASSQMFVDSARSIRLDVLDNQGKYDFFKQEVERYRDVMMSLTDASLIQDYAAKINQTLMASWGVLDDTQKQASVDKYEKLFTDAQKLTDDRLAQAQQNAADDRMKWAEAVGSAINASMDRAAAKIAAAVPQRIEVGVNVSGNVAASSEVVAY